MYLPPAYTVSTLAAWVVATGRRAKQCVPGRPCSCITLQIGLPAPSLRLALASMLESHASGPAAAKLGEKGATRINSDARIWGTCLLYTARLGSYRQDRTATTKTTSGQHGDRSTSVLFPLDSPNLSPSFV